MKLASLFLCATIAWAQCVPNSQTGCPDPVATGDVTGSVPLIHCEAGTASAGIKYNGANTSDVYYVCYPKAATLATLPMIVCVGDNGWTPLAQRCLWGTSTSSAQQVIPAEWTYAAVYTVIHEPAANGPWPLPIQGVGCFLAYLVANAGSSTTVPGNVKDIRGIAVSSGTVELWWLTRMTPGTTFPVGSCANATPSVGSYKITANVLMSSPLCNGLKTGNCAAGSSYDGGHNPGSTGNNALKSVLNVVLNATDSATAASQDAALNMSPLGAITSGNAFAARELYMYAVGCNPYPDGTGTNGLTCPNSPSTGGENGDLTVPPSVNSTQLRTYLNGLNAPAWNTYFLEALAPGRGVGSNCPSHNLDNNPGGSVCDLSMGGLQGFSMPYGFWFLNNQVRSNGSGLSGTTGSNGAIF